MFHLHHQSPETWVAIWTGVLAGATFLMALFTARAARASASEVAVTVRPLIVDAPSGVFMQQRNAGSFRVDLSGTGGGTTMIVDAAATRTSRGTGTATVDFAIRNAGSGPALIRSFSVTGPDASPSSPDDPTVSVSLSHTVIPLGEPARVVVVWTSPMKAALEALSPSEQLKATDPMGDFLEALRPFVVTLNYSDMTGRQATVSVFELRRGESSWEVGKVKLFRRRSLRRMKPFAELERHL